jgi:hypothetical protein
MTDLSTVFAVLNVAVTGLVIYLTVGAPRSLRGFFTLPPKGEYSIGRDVYQGWPPSPERWRGRL